MGKRKQHLNMQKSPKKSDIPTDLADCLKTQAEQLWLLQTMLDNGYTLPQSGRPERNVAIPLNSGTMLTGIAYTVGFEVGRDYGENILMNYYPANDLVYMNIHAVTAAATCDNGKMTRKTLQKDLTSLQVALALYQKTIEELSQKPLFTINMIHVERLVNYCSELTALAQQFLDSANIADQLKLQSFISENDEVVAELHEEAKTAPRGGRPPDPVREYIGKYAAEYKDPKTRKYWEIGKQLFDELSAMPSSVMTPIQSLALAQLQSFMREDGKNVMYRTDLGTYISEVKTAYLNRSRN